MSYTLKSFAWLVKPGETFRFFPVKGNGTNFTDYVVLDQSHDDYVMVREVRGGNEQRFNPYADVYVKDKGRTSCATPK